GVSVLVAVGPPDVDICELLQRYVDLPGVVRLHKGDVAGVTVRPQDEVVHTHLRKLLASFTPGSGGLAGQLNRTLKSPLRQYTFVHFFTPAPSPPIPSY